MAARFRGREEELKHVGSVSGQTSSAFILLFPNVIVVEFADMGRAYCYTGERRKRLELDMWRSEPFGSHDLKSMELAEKSLPHMNGWEYHMETALAQLGIRPGSRRR